MVAIMDDELMKFARALWGVQLGFQDRSIELEKRISQLQGEKNQFEENLTQEKESFQLELEKEREATTLKLKEVRAESVAEAERLVTASATSRNNLVGKLYQLRYTKAEITTFNKGNYKEMKIMDEEEIEEREDGLNVAEKTVVHNQETINQIESSRLRVVDLEGLLEVEKKSSAELQEKDALAIPSLPCFTSLSVCFYRSISQLDEYVALSSQYEDRLDDNVKLTLKLEEAKRQVEERTASIVSRDLALNQLTSELVELKKKASGSRHEAELAKNLLKREIDLDTARTNLAVPEADLEKLSSSIAGKDRELRNSEQIRDSLIAKLYFLKVDLHRLKGGEAQNRADLREVQAKNKSLVDELAQARGNMRRVLQRDKEMNEIIKQLCGRISELERELRVREMKYQKDLKFELDKRDGEIASGEGSREMK
ncbi:hypothetical protein GIB67_005616 [Kingdonia uniflora]|uniref:Uncharacterized protein n=1 Tax=Kingdonia uniflora TaxID=39325 RepID=A0A7J7NIA8_9MAGN|nr:hypothetical protein GIB67_005616 [Kingdonia uniflora]